MLFRIKMKLLFDLVEIIIILISSTSPLYKEVIERHIDLIDLIFDS